jgi:hypothetical protein
MTSRAPGAATAALLLSLVAACSTGPDAPGGEAAPPHASAAPSGAAPSGAAPSGTAVSGEGGEHAGAWDVSKMPDPCLEIDAAQVTKATGLSVQKGVFLESWPPLCAFTFTTPGPEYLYVSADPRPEARADYDRQRSDSQRTASVPGIGDDAYWLPEFTALHVFDGTTHVTVKFAGSAPPADPKGKALALARVVLR